MSFLSDTEIAGLNVDRMIIHLVGKQVAFRAESETPVQQQEFFQSRIIEHAASSVHKFTEHSLLRPIIEEMASRKIGFEAGGQKLAHLFWHDHTSRNVAGAFFVFELSTGVDGDILYALIKYDYKAVVELSQNKGQNVLREIVQAFVKDRRAVQKFCLIRYSKGKVEDTVSATDRMAESPDLTDYFQNYLGIHRARSTAELSTRLNEAMRAALNNLKSHIPDGAVGPALARAKQALGARAVVTNDDVVDAILHAAGRPVDEKVISQIGKVTRGKLKVANLTDVDFKPDAKVLQVQPARKVKTAEGVKIEFPEEELGRSVTHEHSDKGDVFIIRTKHDLVEDDTIAIRPR